VTFLGKFIIKIYIWATDQLYHSFAWAYDFVAWLVSFGNWSNWRMDTLQYLQSGNVLEIGFGTGALISEMTGRQYDVYGLELSPQMQKVTRRRARVEGISLKIIQAKAQALPFSERKFNNIISTFPSNYIFDDDTLKEIKRVLTIDGRVVITGFGVLFKSGIKNWLTGWFLNKGSDSFIKAFSQRAEELGFNPNLVQHQGNTYTLSIIILEKENDS